MKRRKKRKVMPRCPAWITRLLDGPELTIKSRKWESVFSQLALAYCVSHFFLGSGVVKTNITQYLSAGLL